MGRNLSPVLRRELENLDKDPDSRKLAMKALKTYVKDLDAKAIPLFLSQVSERKEPGSSSGEYTISLYEVLARVHGRNIVPQIENIMSTIIRTLSSSAGSFPLHQACAKVVPAIARYGIDPSTPDDEKMRIVGSLCKPLADVLMSPIESATSGAALCLKALVESDNWRFASNDAVNDVCLKVAGALEEKHTQTNAHMSLAMALSKHNALIAEAYARSLVRSGLQILTTGAKECNSQKRMSAIQMINFLMKHTDSRSISSELDKVVVVMEKSRGDRMPFVGSAALDALQTAKMITGQKGSEHEISLSPVVGSNFDRDGRSLSLDDGDYVSNSKSNGFPAEFASPESRTVESLLEHDASVDSPMSVGQASSNFEYARRATRRLWNNDSWGVDVSLRDGLFRKDGTGCEVSKFYLEQFRNGDLSESHEDHSETFSGFPQATVDAMSSNSLSSPQRSRPQLTVDDVKIYSTPRKLIRSLQNSTTANSEGHDHQQSRAPATPTSGEVAWNPARVNGSTNSQVSNYEVNERKNRHDMSLLKNTRISHDSDSVTDCSRTASSASAAHAEHACNGSCGLDSGYKNGAHEVSMKKNRKSKAFIGFFCFIFLILLAIFSSAIWMGNSEALHDAVPT